MSVMSERHDDLVTIRNILLGQRKVAADTAFDLKIRGCNIEAAGWDIKVGSINDVLLEIEASGVQWPDNVEVLHG